MRALHRHAANGATVAAGVEGGVVRGSSTVQRVADDVQEEGEREGVPVDISIKLNVVHPDKVSEPEKRRSPATTSIVPLNATML